MVGIIERIGSLAGTETAKAVNLAHHTFTGGMGRHGHAGRAIIETIGEVCRNHPNLVGIGAGLLVEQLLVEEKRRHEAHLAAEPAPFPTDGGGYVAGPASGIEHPDHPDHHLHFPHIPTTRLSHLRPGRVAFEVFGALLLLKMGSTGARLFRRKGRPEIWFAPVARIHLLSGTLAAYYVTKALSSPKISAWRNAAIGLFATDAIKPLLKHRPSAAEPAMAEPAPSLQLS